ncbi:hypothetical protein DV517_30370 [Streptomyces sp. S816]|uniref:hypothetical protein n=1 Tax=Streptomyces sp. S816 TaxID=2283197 RepID=UPI00109D81B9|nr:hypothetical protein [Streptomyces sp. S816]TGZ18064.1 hypothetical protein DV517_30370 [Streptomyces sp. S816]
MIKPEEIPEFTGDLEQLEKDYGALKKDAGQIRSTGADVHTQFQGLSAYYKAPEADQLFASTKPVSDRADTFGTDLETVSSALSGYATEIRPLVAKLKQLKHDAQTFVDSVEDDDDWQYDEDKVKKNNQLRDDVTATVAAFWAAERTCHNKITALWHGTQMIAGDGTDKKNMYGYSASDLKGAKGLPWGDPVEQKHHWYDVGHWAKSFVWDGIVVDGIWGTVKGLGTLVGVDGWDAMKTAWKGLAQLATGLAFMSNPVLAVAFWATPDKYMPSWLRESRNTMKQTGKALLAWDEWGKNPARAAGGVTFNVLTAVFTDGAGAAAEGAGKAGAVAKAISFAGKAGRVIDPMTYVMKGAGAGLSKIGDISKALKGAGKIDIPELPDNAITLPEGTVHLPDGTVHLPEGASIPKGAVELPDGSVRLPHDAPLHPAGTDPLHTPEGEPPLFADEHGNIVDHKGDVLMHHDGGPPDITNRPHSGSDVPHTPSPAKEPVLAGAAAHGADRAGEHVHLGSSLDDTGRAGESVPTSPGVHAGGDRIPGGNGLGDHLPGGRADGHMPTNSVDTHVPAGGAGDAAHVTTPGDHLPGGHTGEPHTPGHDLPGHGGDNHVPGHGGDPHTGSGDAGGTGHDGFDHAGSGDDATHSAHNPSHHADEVARHRAEYEAAREKPASERTPAERAAINREHVRLANEDPAWREEHYNKIGRRHNSRELVDGQILPQLTEKPGGGWMAADHVPHADPEKYLPEHFQRDRTTVPHDHRDHLDDVSARRRVGMELTSAEKNYEALQTHEHALALDSAQKHFDETVGVGVSNNSKLGEALGEGAARHHMLLQKEFEGATEVTDLPETPNGSKRFDQLWRGKDGHLIIVEAKGPTARLDWRLGNGDVDRGTMVKQGTIEYVRTIVADMEDRAMVSPDDGKYAEEIKAAIENKSLQYVLVQALENNGKYAGAELHYFKIF